MISAWKRGDRVYPELTLRAEVRLCSGLFTLRGGAQRTGEALNPEYFVQYVHAKFGVL
jgi:hypothetical protein